MKQRRYLVTLCLILGLTLLTSIPVMVAGQETTNDTAEEENLRIVQEYLETRDPALLAEDALFHDRTMRDPMVGRDEISWQQDEFFMYTFTESSVEPVRYFVSDNVVIAEFRFRGVHSGQYMGAPPSGEYVEVMMVGIFEVHDRQIQSADLYYDAASIHSQVGYGPNVGFTSPMHMDPAMAPGVGAENLRRVIEDPTTHEGETVTVEGIIDERIGDHSFVLREDGFLGDERILVIDGTDEGLDFIRLDDAHVRVSGTIYRDYNTSVEMGSHAHMQEDFVGYENLLVLVATSVQNLDDVESLGTLTDEPGAFYGQSVRLEGSVGEQIGERAFILREDAFMGWLFGEDDILVLVEDSDTAMDFVPLSDTRVRVAGTVQAFTRADLEAQGYVLDDERFSDREGEPVIVANSVVNLEDVNTLSNVTDEPEAFYGQQVSVEGLVGDRVGTQGFELREDVFLGSIFGEGRILVVYRDELMFDAEAWDDETVRVTGTVQPFIRAEIESELGYTFTDERFADYEQDAVIIADEITPVD